MANDYPMMNYGRPYPKTPEQLQNEMQASIDQYQNMFQSYQMTPQMQRPPARRGGEYYKDGVLLPCTTRQLTVAADSVYTIGTRAPAPWFDRCLPFRSAVSRAQSITFA